METDFRVVFAKMDPQAIVVADELAVLLQRSAGAVAVLAHRGRLPQKAFPQERKLCWFAGDIRDWLATIRAEQSKPVSSSVIAAPAAGAVKMEPRRIGRPRFRDQ